MPSARAKLPAAPSRRPRCYREAPPGAPHAPEARADAHDLSGRRAQPPAPTASARVHVRAGCVGGAGAAATPDRYGSGSSARALGVGVPSCAQIARSVAAAPTRRPGSRRLLERRASPRARRAEPLTKYDAQRAPFLFASIEAHDLVVGRRGPPRRSSHLAKRSRDGSRGGGEIVRRVHGAHELVARERCAATAGAGASIESHSRETGKAVRDDAADGASGEHGSRRRGRPQCGITACHRVLDRAVVSPTISIGYGIRYGSIQRNRSDLRRTRRRLCAPTPPLKPARRRAPRGGRARRSAVDLGHAGASVFPCHERDRQR